MRGAGLVTGLVGAALLAAAPALAGIEHEVGTAPSPSTHAPIAGGGTWLVNKPSGYYVGRAPSGALFVNELTSPRSHWHYGRAATAVKLCAWAMPRSFARTVGRVRSSCSARTRVYLSHRLNIGKDFNAAAHKARTGTVVKLTGPCELRYNYFHGTRFDRNGGHWADSAGTIPVDRTKVLYRFTTLDGQAAVVRDPVLGWGFVKSGCLARPFRFKVYNDAD